MVLHVNRERSGWLDYPAPAELPSRMTNSPGCRQVFVGFGIKVVRTVDSNLSPCIHMFRDNGIKVLTKCTLVLHAVNPWSPGLDGVSV